MTHVSILGPPRNIRKVVTPEEFFKEVESWKKVKEKCDTYIDRAAKPKKKGDSPKETIPRPAVNSARDYFLFPGRFEVGSIDDLSDFFVFHDLALPMGFWKSLFLCKTLPNEVRKQYNWRPFTLKHQPEGVIPLDVYYGLAAVCYLRRDDLVLPEAIREDIFVPDSNGNFPFNSTYFSLGNNGDDVVTVGSGWPIGHPFSAQYKANTSLGDGSYIVDLSKQNPKAARMLRDLLGEDDSSRCAKVINWMTSGNSPRISQDELGQKTMALATARFTKTLKNHAYLWLRDSVHSKSSARLVEADPKDYSIK